MFRTFLTTILGRMFGSAEKPIQNCPESVTAPQNLRKRLVPYRQGNPPPDEVAAKARLMWLYLKAETFREDQIAEAIGIAPSPGDLGTLRQRCGESVAAAVFTVRQIWFLERWLEDARIRDQNELESWWAAEEEESARLLRRSLQMRDIASRAAAFLAQDVVLPDDPTIGEPEISGAIESLRSAIASGNRMQNELSYNSAKIVLQAYAERFGGGKRRVQRIANRLLATIYSTPDLLGRLTAA